MRGVRSLKFIRKQRRPRKKGAVFYFLNRGASLGLKRANNTTTKTHYTNMNLQLMKFGTDGNIKPGEMFWASMMAFPARCNSEQAARLLGFQVHDIPVLIKNRLLTPLAKPVPNATKYFHIDELVQLARDPVFLKKATQATYDFWNLKNGQKATHNMIPDRKAKPSRKYMEPAIDIESTEVTPEMAVVAVQ